MSTSWRVQGSDLTAGGVVVVVEPGSPQQAQKVRQQTVPRLHSLPTRHNLGLDLPTWTFRFRFIGPSPARLTALYNLRETLKNTDPFTLQAPDSPNEVYFNNASKTLTLSLDSLATDYRSGVGECALTVNCTESS